jgi:hypothetical protein
VRAKARVLDGSGAAAKARAERDAAECVKAAETRVRQAKSKAKKEAFVAMLQGTQLERDEIKLKAMLIPELHSQIDKLRFIDKALILPKSNFKKKGEKLAAIVVALARLALVEQELLSAALADPMVVSGGVVEAAAEAMEVEQESQSVSDEEEMEFEVDL